MGFSTLISRRVITTDSSTRLRKIDRFIVHHAATTSLEAILNLFQPGGRTVSANYALGSSGELVGCVDEDRRAWTSSSEAWDGRAVTIEVANSHAGDPWPVSDAAFDKLARLIADVATRYGFPITDDTILTHQELYRRYGASYATACPGDLQRRKPELLRLAKTYQTTPHPSTPDVEPVIEEDEMFKVTARHDDGKDTEWCLIHPGIGQDLARGKSRKDGTVTTFRGYMVTTSTTVGTAWSRTYCRPYASVPLRLPRAQYIAAQVEATRVALELA